MDRVYGLVCPVSGSEAVVVQVSFGDGLMLMLYGGLADRDVVALNNAWRMLIEGTRSAVLAALTHAWGRLD